jgi:hypothetical protein
MSADDLSSKSSEDLDSITINLSDYDHAHSDSIYTMSTTTDTITLSSLTDSNVIVGGGYSVPWTTTTGISDTFTLGSSWNQPASGKIKLNGPDADIEVNGQSLINMLRNIEQRLNILKPNEELESEWSELRALGEQYRALEKHILEKQATWDKLKAMPPPDLD